MFLTNLTYFFSFLCLLSIFTSDIFKLVIRFIKFEKRSAYVNFVDSADAYTNNELNMLVNLVAFFVMFGSYRFAKNHSTYYKFPSKLVLLGCSIFVAITSITVIPISWASKTDSMNDSHYYVIAKAFGTAFLFLVFAVLAWYSCPNNEEEFESENCWNSFAYSVGILLFIITVVADVTLIIVKQNESTAAARNSSRGLLVFALAADIAALCFTVIHPFVVPVTWSSKLISCSSRISFFLIVVYMARYLHNLPLEESLQLNAEQFLNVEFIAAGSHLVISIIASVIASSCAFSLDDFASKNKNNFL